MQVNFILHIKRTNFGVSEEHVIIKEINKNKCALIYSHHQLCQTPVRGLCWGFACRAPRLLCTFLVWGNTRLGCSWSSQRSGRLGLRFARKFPTPSNNTAQPLRICPDCNLNRIINVRLETKTFAQNFSAFSIFSNLLYSAITKQNFRSMCKLNWKIWVARYVQIASQKLYWLL